MMMAKFNLVCEVTVSALTTVEADSLEEALEIAEERKMVLGNHYSPYTRAWVVDEIDGLPQNIREE